MREEDEGEGKEDEFPIFISKRTNSSLQFRMDPPKKQKGVLYVKAVTLKATCGFTEAVKRLINCAKCLKIS